MTHSNTLYQYYIDNIILETVSTNGLLKRAQVGDVLSGIAQSIKNYVSNRIDPNDRVGSVIDILAPGAIAVLLKPFGLGGLIGLAMNIFNVDVAGILRSIWEKVKSLLGVGQRISPEQADQIVETSVKEHQGSFTEEDAAKAHQKLTQNNQSKTSSYKAIRDARTVKLAIIQYENFSLTKEAQLFGRKSRRSSSSFDFSSLFGEKVKTTNTLTTILSWVLKIVLVAAGVDIGGQLIRKFLGMSNAFDGPAPAGKDSGGEQAAPQSQPSTSHQTKFKVQPNYKDIQMRSSGEFWIENVPNNESSIEEMLVNFAKQVYQGLDGQESVIKSSPGFEVILKRIVNFNRGSKGNQSIIIPFNSKKQIVDFFIDDVAEKAA